MGDLPGGRSITERAPGSELAEFGFGHYQLYSSCPLRHCQLYSSCRSNATTTTTTDGAGGAGGSGGGAASEEQHQRSGRQHRGRDGAAVVAAQGSHGLAMDCGLCALKNATADRDIDGNAAFDLALALKSELEALQDVNKKLDAEIKQLKSRPADTTDVDKQIEEALKAQ